MKKNIGDIIISKNNQFLAFNKPNGMLVQSGQEEEKSLLQLAEIYCQHPLGLVHRLDRPASGVCILAKNKKALAHINQQMQDRKVKKIYWAVVPKGDLETQGELTHYLKRNGKTKKAECSDEERGGYKKAILHYKIIGEIERYMLLEIELITGRFHQIRAQLGAIGFPIKGDQKYGAKRGNKDRSIHLHARKITLKHPVSKEDISLTADTPDDVIWKAFEEVNEVV